MTRIVLRDVEVDRRRVDVTIADGSIVSVDPTGSGVRPDDAIDGGGGALVSGLWDHHIHLLGLAAALRSVSVGPPAVRTPDDLADALQTAVPDETGWIRAVGYHDSVAGPLDRDDLDRIVPGRRVRVQHRSGQRWSLSSAAVDALRIDLADHPGIERDGLGRPTGRLHGADELVRLPGAQPPDLAPVGRLLASFGVVGVTDATPYESAEPLAHLADGARRGALHQRVVITGGPGLATRSPTRPLGSGPVKLLYPDHDLPSLDRFVADITTARRADRTVAIHCVTRTGLVLALAALDETGVRLGDRIEHGSVIPPELADRVHDLGLVVVTQPNFVAERGDRYLTDVEPDDLPHLYRCGSLLERDIPVAGSTDAPFGDPDPWRAVRAAIDRTTDDGRVLGPAERLDPPTALGLFLGGPHDPAVRSREVSPGSPADLCLLDRPLAEALVEPSADRVRATLIGGDVVYEA